MRLGQIVFTAEAVEDGDAKAFVALRRLTIAEKARELDRAKLDATLKTKLELGLDALFEEIKGNAKAEELFNELRATVAEV